MIELVKEIKRDKRYFLMSCNLVQQEHHIFGRNTNEGFNSNDKTVSQIEGLMILIELDTSIKFQKKNKSGTDFGWNLELISQCLQELQTMKYPKNRVPLKKNEADKIKKKILHKIQLQRKVEQSYQFEKQYVTCTIPVLIELYNKTQKYHIDGNDPFVCVTDKLERDNKLLQDIKDQYREEASQTLIEMENLGLIVKGQKNRRVAYGLTRKGRQIIENYQNAEKENGYTELSLKVRPNIIENEKKEIFFWKKTFVLGQSKNQFSFHVSKNYNISNNNEKNFKPKLTKHMAGIAKVHSCKRSFFDLFFQKQEKVLNYFVKVIPLSKVIKKKKGMKNSNF